MDADLLTRFLEGDANARESLLKAHLDVLSGRFSSAVGEVGSLDVTLEQFGAHVLRAACGRVAKACAAGHGTSVEDVLSRLHFTDLYLACAMGEGNEAAWGVFTERFRNFLVSASAGFTRERGYAEQVAGDILGDLFFTDRGAGRSRILTYNGTSTLDRWLWLVLQHRIVDVVRRRRFEVSLDDVPGLETLDDSPAHDPDRSVVASAEECMLERQREGLLKAVIPLAFSDLEPQDRLLLKLHYVDGVRQRHIAALYGVHESRISRWIDRACRQVMKHATHRLTRDHGLDFKEATELVRAVTEVDLGGKALRALEGEESEAPNPAAPGPGTPDPK